jgi:iron(III) transport system ATP-binding protein
MAMVEVEHLGKTYGSTAAVRDLSFSVERGEILGILGASGCGKTTTLRCLAGLTRPTSGAIRIDGTTMSNDASFVPTERRGVGMVFQSYALWPHMTVLDNVMYGLKQQRIPPATARTKGEEALALVGLSGYGARHPAELSGGQQQRVALARSFVTNPRVLLLDEPLSNLDARLRERMREDIKALIRRVGITTIFITHDRAEAMVISDRIIVMRDGAAIQSGTARDLYLDPRSRFVAAFLGPASFLDGVIERIDGSSATLRIEGGSTITFRPGPGDAVGARASLVVRPELVDVSTSASATGNALPGVVRGASFLGGYTIHIVDVGGVLIEAHSRGSFTEGANVFVNVDAAHLTSVPPEES